MPDLHIISEHLVFPFIPGTRLDTVLHEHGWHSSPCGGKGICGKCLVRFTQNAPAAVSRDVLLLSKEQIQLGWRLACCVYVDDEDIFLELPPKKGSPRILSHTQITSQRRSDISCTFLPGENVFSVQRDGVEIRRLPETEKCYLLGVAVDVGTTTLVMTLLNLEADDRENPVLGCVSRMNPQIRYGYDVISRIQYTIETPDGSAVLQGLLVDAVREMLKELLLETGMKIENVLEILFSGNTTMQELLLGLDVKSLSHVPFTPSTELGTQYPPTQLKLGLAPYARIRVSPVISGFIGGDITSGLVASQLDKYSRPTLLVDVGTNGEMVLNAAGHMVGCATAAGPALEGARIHCGMNASAGAVEHIFTDEKNRSVILKTVQDAPAVGICGSALIDLTAELLQAGVLGCNGRLDTPQTPQTLPSSDPLNFRESLWRQRLFLWNGMPAVRLTSDVFMTQEDIRQLQLAVGAIRAGIRILIKRCGLKISDLDKILLAGGFGANLKIQNAQRIGLIPPELDSERICYCGNTSLGGAQDSLLDYLCWEKAADFAACTESMDLSLDPEFTEIFTECMFFPE